MGCLFKIHNRGELLYVRTLSKILCKCKQDSVVSHFLYLDFVYIYTRYFVVSRLTALVADCFFGSKPESLPLHM